MESYIKAFCMQEIIAASGCTKREGRSDEKEIMYVPYIGTSIIDERELIM